MGKSKNPAFPDADPTAPGGMSQKALADELVEKHGWTKAQIRDEFRQGRGWRVGSWPEMITVVCEERRARELEAGTEALDPDQMFGEIEQAREEARANALLVPDPVTYDYQFNGHAGAGPSASERWMSCTASLRASREFLETLTPNQQEEFSKASTSARQGTTAHAAAEIEARVLLGQMDQDEADLSLLELTVNPADDEAYDEEMAEYITEYVDLIRSYVDDHEVLIEERVVASIWLTGAHEEEVYEIPGSVDVTALPSESDPSTLVVGDLKYGKGVNVDVEKNSQTRLYALGVLGRLVDDEGALPEGLTTIRYHIIQPRLGGIKTWEESVEDLLTWRDEELAPALTAALYGEGAEFKPSETACQFCPARGSCAALTEQRVTEAAGLFDVIVDAEFNGQSFPETASLSDTRLGELLTQINGLIDIHKDLKEEAQRRLFRGGTVPGFKMVSYTPPRKWKPEAETKLADVEEVWKRKLLTPKQAIEVLKNDEDKALMLEGLYDTPNKRPVVAPEGDRRSDWEGLPPEAMFTAEEGEKK